MKAKLIITRFTSPDKVVDTTLIGNPRGVITYEDTNGSSHILIFGDIGDITDIDSEDIGQFLTEKLAVPLNPKVIPLDHDGITVYLRQFMEPAKDTE